MRVALFISLICAGLLLVPGTDAYTADQACCAEAEISRAQTESSLALPAGFSIKINLGCSDPVNETPFDTVNPSSSTSGQATDAKTQLDFDLPAGLYDIKVMTKGCKGKTPNETTTIHTGDCKGVSVGGNSLAKCTLFMMDDEQLSALERGVAGTSNEAVITNLLIADARVDAGAPNPLSDIEVVVRDHSSSAQQSHAVKFKIFDPQNLASTAITATFADPNDPTHTASATLDAECNVTHASSVIGYPLFNCPRQLVVGADRGTIHFSAQVVTNIDGADKDGDVLYGSIAVDDVNRDSFLLQELHKPKVCDVNAPPTLDDEGDAHGPAIPLEIDDTAFDQTGLGKASNPADALQAPMTGGIYNGARSFDKIRVPAVYTGKTYGNDWDQEWLWMETYVLDEDLGFRGSQEQISLKIKVEELNPNVDSNRVNPGCGFLAAGDYTGIPYAGAVYADNFDTTEITTSSYDGSADEGAVAVRAGSAPNTYNKKMLRIRWRWCPFCRVNKTAFVNDPRENGRTYRPLTDLTVSATMLNEAVGMSRCQFEVMATDDTATYATVTDGGTTTAAHADQTSNKVYRVFRVGEIPNDSEAVYAEPLPMYQAGFVMDTTPRARVDSNAQLIPVAFALSKANLCSDLSANATLAERDEASTRDLYKYCDARDDADAGAKDYAETLNYNVRFSLVTDVTSTGEPLYTEKAKMQDFKVTVTKATVTDTTKNPCKTFTDGAMTPWNSAFNPGTNADGNACQIAAPTDTTAFVVSFNIKSMSTAELDTYELRIQLFNENDEAVFDRWYTNRWEFTVTNVDRPQLLSVETGGNRRRRSVHMLQGHELPMAAQRALGVGQGRRRRSTVAPLLTGSFVTFDGTKDVTNGDVAFTFTKDKLVKGEPAYPATIALQTDNVAKLATDALLADTAALCNELIVVSQASADPTGPQKAQRNEAQLVALVNLYNSLMEKVVYAGAAETSAIEKIMTGLVSLEAKNSDTPSDLKELKAAVIKVLEEQKSIEASVLAASKLTNTTFTPDQMNNYLIGMLESFESALVTVQYQSVEARNHRLALAAAPAAISNDKWVDSAEGWTQIWMLTMITIMFIYGFCRAIQPQGPEGKQRWFQLPLRENMNF